MRTFTTRKRALQGHTIVAASRSEAAFLVPATFANVARYGKPSGFHSTTAAEAATCAGKRRKKRRCSIAPHRSEIRWYLFPVIYQISSQFHAFISVPEPQDQLTI